MIGIISLLLCPEILQNGFQRDTIGLKTERKPIGSAVAIVPAAAFGCFLGTELGQRTNDAFTGAMRLAVIAGFVCVIYTIENSEKK